MLNFWTSSTLDKWNEQLSCMYYMVGTSGNNSLVGTDHVNYATYPGLQLQERPETASCFVTEHSVSTASQSCYHGFRLLSCVPHTNPAYYFKAVTGNVIKKYHQTLKKIQAVLLKECHTSTMQHMKVMKK